MSVHINPNVTEGKLAIDPELAMQYYLEGKKVLATLSEPDGSYYAAHVFSKDIQGEGYEIKLNEFAEFVAYGRFWVDKGEVY